MRRTATVLALCTAVLAPAPALAQGASPSPSPSAVCPNVFIIEDEDDAPGPADVPVTITGGSDVQPAKTPDRWTLTRISPGPVEVVQTIEKEPSFSFTVTVAETTTFRIEAVGPQGCGPTFADFTRIVTSASPAPSPAPSNCNSGGFVSVSRPSSQRIVAGERVTLTLTGKGAVDNAYATFSGYRWETPTRRGDVEFVTPKPNDVVQQVSPLAQGQSATATVVLRPTTSTRVSTRFGYRAGCLFADGGSARPDEVIDVAPRLTLTAVRNGYRDYTFSGVATTPGLILNLYRVEADGRRVLTSQTRATEDRTWTINRKFLGSGRFGFVVLTGRTMANAPGRSNERPTVIH